MADRGTLGLIGYILCGVTVAVTMIGAVVVSDHISGRHNLDDANFGILSTPAAAR